MKEIGTVHVEVYCPIELIRRLTVRNYPFARHATTIDSGKFCAAGQLIGYRHPVRE